MLAIVGGLNRCLSLYLADDYLGICDEFGFWQVGHLLGPTMQTEHTMIDKWAYSLKLQRGDEAGGSGVI
ncbi:hypothetical protein BJY00DRAFT_108976 [Aspergillus carlsbadensis]|nr:hypothetical protein BJY00DRAFT_108976 [Aspergillus carlsbadensis]